MTTTITTTANANGTTSLATTIDHLHYDVKAQRLLVVVVTFAGNFESSSSPLAQENRDGGKKNTLTVEDVPVASFKGQKATSSYKTKSVKMKKSYGLRFVVKFQRVFPPLESARLFN